MLGKFSINTYFSQGGYVYNLVCQKDIRKSASLVFPERWWKVLARAKGELNYALEVV